MLSKHISFGTTSQCCLGYILPTAHSHTPLHMSLQICEFAHPLCAWTSITPSPVMCVCEPSRAADSQCSCNHLKSLFGFGCLKHCGWDFNIKKKNLLRKTICLCCHLRNGSHNSYSLNITSKGTFGFLCPFLFLNYQWALGTHRRRREEGSKSPMLPSKCSRHAFTFTNMWKCCQPQSKPSS